MAKDLRFPDPPFKQAPQLHFLTPSVWPLAAPSAQSPNTEPVEQLVVKALFQRIAIQFEKLYRRKALVHWYTGEGMDQEEFIKADQALKGLITHYQDAQDQTS